MQMGMKTLWILLLAVLAVFQSPLRAGNLYVVVAGVADYQYLNPLNLPEKDAQLIAGLYKQKTKNVVLLTGRYATKQRILNSLRQQFARAGEDDMVVFAFSGHGYRGGICPYEMEDEQDGISYREIQSILKQSKARKKIIWADACYSGGLRLDGREDESPQPEATDVVFFLSSRTGETSQEIPFKANGIFTTHLVRGLRGGADANRDRKITARELFLFVSQRVTQESQGEQHPVMWGNFDDNYVVMDWSR